MGWSSHCMSKHAYLSRKQLWILDHLHGQLSVDNFWEDISISMKNISLSTAFNAWSKNSLLSDFSTFAPFLSGIFFLMTVDLLKLYVSMISLLANSLLQHQFLPQYSFVVQSISPQLFQQSFPLVCLSVSLFASSHFSYFQMDILSFQSCLKTIPKLCGHM